MHEVAVGCAGWSIPGGHRALFGKGESVLARYASRFPVVEINSSFYRSHRQATYARWAASVPAAFRFSVKIPRTISHDAQLQGCGGLLDAFIEETTGLDEKLGGFLLQLPPSFRFDMRVASTFFRMLRRRSAAPLACEPRHASWACDAAQALFSRHAISRVIADPAIPMTEDRASPTSPWPYWRLHGAPRMYYSTYPDDALRGFASAALARRSSTMAPWVIFDNTAHGFSVANAALLQAMTKARPRSRSSSKDTSHA